MAQTFPNIAATDLVSASRANILARDEALKSNFAGTTYPTTNLVAGQVCFRTDLKKVYMLEQVSPVIWREVVFASNLGTAASAAIGTSGDTVPKNNTANVWSALQTFAAGFNFGSQTLTGNSGSIRADTDLRLNALVEKNINFLINNASKMIINFDGGVTVGAATGGSKGDGSLNAVTLYQNGVALGTGAFATIGNYATVSELNSRVSVSAASSRNANANTTYTFNQQDAAWQEVVVSSNCTFAFTFTPGLVCSFILAIVDGGDYTITWPVAMNWPDGELPILTSGGTDHVCIYSDGVNLYGSLIALNVGT
jgi:hypothetical protein